MKITEIKYFTPKIGMRCSSSSRWRPTPASTGFPPARLTSKGHGTWWVAIMPYCEREVLHDRLVEIPRRRCEGTRIR